MSPMSDPTNQYPSFAASMLECIRSLLHLQTLSLHLDFAYIYPEGPDDAFWSLLVLLSSVHASQSFRALLVSLIPSESDGEGYYLSRAAVLGTLGMGEALQERIDAFVRFRTLRLSVAEFDSSRVGWWRRDVLVRMPGLAGVVEVMAGNPAAESTGAGHPG